MTRAQDERDLRSSLAEFVSAKVTPQVLEKAEQEGLLALLWSETAELGLPWIGLPEHMGGAGGSLRELVWAMEVLGEHAVPLPVAETSLAAWLLHRAGEAADQVPMSIAPGSPADSLVHRSGTFTGSAHDVPWGRCVERVLLLAPAETGSRTRIVSVRPADCDVVEGCDIAGMPRDTLVIGDTSSVEPVGDLTASDWGAMKARASLLRAAQIAGAVEGVYQLTRRYVMDREQFGRRISEFQSVQQHLVALAQASAISSLAVGTAAELLDDLNAFDAGAAKLVANHSATTAVTAGHQAHGAIGMTREYPLQYLTRRLNAWRGEFGDDQALSLSLGGAVVAVGNLSDVVVGAGVGRQVGDE